MQVAIDQERKRLELERQAKMAEDIGNVAADCEQSLKARYQDESRRKIERVSKKLEDHMKEKVTQLMELQKRQMENEAKRQRYLREENAKQ